MACCYAPKIAKTPENIDLLRCCAWIPGRRRGETPSFKVQGSRFKVQGSRFPRWPGEPATGLPSPPRPGRGIEGEVSLPVPLRCLRSLLLQSLSFEIAVFTSAQVNRAT